MKKNILLAVAMVAIILCPSFLWAQNIVTTFAGIGPDGTVPSGSLYNGDSILATKAALSYMGNTIVDSAGNVYIAGDLDRRIRKVDAGGIITTYAGGGTATYHSGAVATSIDLPPIESIAFDRHWNMYLCFGTSIKKINPAGIITDFAGGFISTYTGDGGPATAAGMLNPVGIVFDKVGNMFFSDLQHNVVRKIDTFGIITTYAGIGTTVSGGTGAFSGDGGPATAAELSYPGDLELDTADNLYISDEFNYRVRKVDRATGIITTIVGSGAPFPASCVYSGEGGPATAARIDPIGLAFDSLGQLYVSGVSTDRICKIDAAGIITTVAGNSGIPGFSGDGGDAMAARFENIDWITFDNCGNLLLTDDMNNRIRKITFNPPVITPTLSVSGPMTAIPGTTVTLTATVGGIPPGYTISWLKNGVLFGTTTGTTITYVKTSGMDTIVATVASNSYKQCYINKVSTEIVVADPTLEVTVPMNTNAMVYPNPVNDVLHIAHNNRNYTTCEIINSLGQIVGVYDFGNEPTLMISTQSLAAGVYIARLTGAESRDTYRFLKE